MGIQSLANSIILQALDDLYDDRHRVESLRFFASRDFGVLAKSARMNTEDQIKILHMVRKIGSLQINKRAYVSFTTAGRATSSPHALPAPSQ